MRPEAASQAPPEARRPAAAVPRSRYVAGLAFAIVCFEVGLVLVVFPWLHYWNWNYFSTLAPGWHQVWVNPYFRGAVSGLGLLNLYLSLLEVLQLQSAAPARLPEGVAGPGAGADRLE